MEANSADNKKVLSVQWSQSMKETGLCTREAGPAMKGWHLKQSVQCNNCDYEREARGDVSVHPRLLHEILFHLSHL